VANSGAGTLYVNESKFVRKGIDCYLNEFCFCPSWAFHLPKSLLKFLVGTFQDREYIVDIWPWVVFPFMPALGTLFKGFIITFFFFLDKTLKADIAAHIIAQVIALEQK